MSYQCELTKQAAQPVLSLRARTAVDRLPQFLGSAYGAIMQRLGELDEHPVGPPFVAYHNMDMQDLDLEAGFPVARSLPDLGDIRAGELPAGSVATCEHVGPYSDIARAYTALGDWMKANGYEGTGVCYEVYLNDPATTPPQELRTQILFPLKT